MGYSTPSRSEGIVPKMCGYQANSKPQRTQRLSQRNGEEGFSAASAWNSATSAVILAAFAATLLVMMFLSSSTARNRRTGRVAPGLWGGPHIRLEVKKDSAAIEYDCAHGTIDHPLVLDRRGRFNVTGTHVREHGGPIRRDETPNELPARYTGWTDGKQMKLTVRLSDTNEVIGTFTLTRGSEGRLFKCR